MTESSSSAFLKWRTVLKTVPTRGGKAVAQSWRKSQTWILTSPQTEHPVQETVVLAEIVPIQCQNHENRLLCALHSQDLPLNQCPLAEFPQSLNRTAATHLQRQDMALLITETDTRFSPGSLRCQTLEPPLSPRTGTPPLPLSLAEPFLSPIQTEAPLHPQGVRVPNLKITPDTRCFPIFLLLV